MPIQIGGPIGPFFDRVQQRQVPCTVVATCEARSSAPITDPMAFEERVREQMLRAIREVTAAKMATGEIQFRHLSQGALLLIPEIIVASRLAQEGIQIGDLTMAYGIDGRAPQRWDSSGGAPVPAGGPPGAPGPAFPPAPPAVGMPNVVHVNLGGINVGGSSQGGFDAGGMGRQLGARAKSAALWYAITGLIALAIAVGMGVYVWNAFKSAPHGAPAAAAKWDGKTHFRCGGNEVVTISGVAANLSGTVITAGGDCSLTLDNVDVSGTTAIEAGGNAVVVVHGGRLHGSVHAVQALGNAKVTLAGTKVSGKMQKEGAAKILGP